MSMKSRTASALIRTIKEIAYLVRVISSAVLSFTGRSGSVIWSNIAANVINLLSLNRLNNVVSEFFTRPYKARS